MRLPVRSAGRPRRGRPVRRASAGIRAGRIAAFVLVLATGAAIYGAAASPAFDLRQVNVTGSTYTASSAIEASMGVVPGAHQNLFSFDTARARRALESLPAVSSAQVRVALPDRLIVHVHERQPILAWEVDGTRELIDASGIVVTTEPMSAPLEPGLPVFADDRSSSRALVPGQKLDSTDLAVARLLGAITPGMIAGGVSSLQWTVTDTYGYLLEVTPAHWRAIFGIYTATLRPPSLIPSQLECLNSLLGTVGATRLEIAYLFPEGGNCGTYVARGAKS